MAVTNQSVVNLTKNALDNLNKVPAHIKSKLLIWVDSVEQLGIHQTRKVPGYHDEPLKGKRAGQRSIRLSKSYRAIYVMKNSGDTDIIAVEEVNKHEY
jgi:proteic killer suppression protein